VIVVNQTSAEIGEMKALYCIRDGSLRLGYSRIAGL
jgi:hypothetical protein